MSWRSLAGLALLGLLLLAALCSLPLEGRLPLLSAAPRVEPFIPRDHESQVMDMVAPVLEAGLFGAHVTDVNIAGREIQLSFGDGSASCGEHVMAPGVVVLRREGATPVLHLGAAPYSGSVAARGIDLAWAWCSDPGPGHGQEVEALAGLIAQHDATTIWNIPRHVNPRRVAGLIEPLVPMTCHDPDAVVCVVWALALLLGVVASMLAAWRTVAHGARPQAVGSTLGDHDRRRLRLAVAVLLLAGVGARIWVGGHASMGIDEHWAQDGTHAVLNSDHDARIHPPLYRATQYPPGTGSLVTVTPLRVGS